MGRFLRLNWKEYGSMAEALARKLHRQGQRFDIVIGIARGGIPLAMVIADKLAVRIDMINVKSYKGFEGKRQRPRILSTITKSIAGKRVLLVDDLVEEGDTLRTVSGYLMQQKPKTLKTAVLFTKPWNKVKPDFYLKMVDRWVVFPWDKNETKRIVRSGGNTEN